MFAKKIIANAIIIGVTTLPMFAYAIDGLKITNYTKRDSTTITNDGPCSTMLGEAGITRAAKGDKPTVNVVSLSDVGKACAASILKKTDCKADVYMSDRCNAGGTPKVATVYFDIQKKDGKYTGTGLRTEKTTIYDHSYSVSGGGFDLSIHGGPASAN